MATTPQQYIQPVAQGASPFLANNGNPNTVYNIPQTGGYLPPQSDAYNNWAINPFANLQALIGSSIVPVAAGYTLPNETPWQAPNLGQYSSLISMPGEFKPSQGGGGQTALPLPDVVSITPPTSQYADPASQFWKQPSNVGPNPGGFVLPKIPGITDGGTPAPTQPTPTEPTPGTGGGVTVPPVNGSPGWGMETPTPYNPDQYGGGASGGGFGMSSGSVSTGAVFGSDGAVKDSSEGQEYNSFLRNVVDTYTHDDGSLDWKQIMDAVTEPFFPGDLYDSNTGNWNKENIVKSVLNTIIPVPFVGNLLYNAAYELMQKMAPDSDMATWMRDARTQQMLNPITAQLKAEAKNMSADEIKKSIDKWKKDQEDKYKVKDKPVASRGGGGCVVVDAVLQDFPRAGDVEVGDDMLISDPVSGDQSIAQVSYSEAKLQPCVRVITDTGVTLSCSTTAPIADEDGNQIMAPDLLGVRIPVMVDGQHYIDTVVDVEDIGEQMVQHITVDDSFFLAGDVDGMFMYHHNKQNIEGKEGRTESNVDGGGGGWTTSWGNSYTPKVSVGDPETVK